MMYFTPSTLPTLASLAALGSARSLLGEVLLGEHGVELLALDHAEGAVVDQRVHDLVGHALADVVVAPPVVVDGAEVEVHDGHRRPLRRPGRCAGAGQARPAPGRRPGPPTSFDLIESSSRSSRLRAYGNRVGYEGPRALREQITVGPSHARAAAAPRTARARGATAASGSVHASVASRSPRPPPAPGAAGRGRAGGRRGPAGDARRDLDADRARRGSAPRPRRRAPPW